MWEKLSASAQHVWDAYASPTSVAPVGKTYVFTAFGSPPDQKSTPSIEIRKGIDFDYNGQGLPIGLRVTVRTRPRSYPLVVISYRNDYDSHKRRPRKSQPRCSAV